MRRISKDEKDGRREKRKKKKEKESESRRVKDVG